MSQGQRVIILFFIFIGILVLCAGSVYIGYMYSQHEMGINIQNLEKNPDSGAAEVINYEKAYKQVYEAGLKEARSDYSLHNPTYQEMKDFLASDQSDSKLYSSKDHICTDFTADVNNNAEKAGINCASVYIIYPETGHSIVAFDTTDNGRIFIEPQYDKEVVLDIGKSYSRSNGFIKQEDIDDTIVRYLIIW